MPRRNKKSQVAKMRFGNRKNSKLTTSNDNDRALESNINSDSNNGKVILDIDEKSYFAEFHVSKIDEKQYVYGSFNQSDIRFGEFAGTQCVANSLLAVLFACHKDVNCWDRRDLNSILTKGNELYAFLYRYQPTRNRYLLISELPNNIVVLEQPFTIDVQSAPLVGLISGENSIYDNVNISMNLTQALQTCFAEYEACFLTFGNSTVAIMKRYGYYYLFDSHSRNSSGLVCNNGTSLLIRINSIIGIHEHCLNLCESMMLDVNTQFEITGLHVIHGKQNANCNESRIVCQKNMDCKLAIEPYEELQEENSDVIISEVETSDFYFTPLSVGERNYLCSQLDISKKDQNDTGSVKRLYLGEPKNIQEIIGDGNCFFRTISYAISGTETHHRIVRLAVVNHLIKNNAIFEPYLGECYTSINDYLSKSKMKYLKSWATEVEIYACADLLQTDIYTYSNKRWLKFTRLQAIDDTISGGIYINHANSNHYEIVLTVTASDKLNDNRRSCLKPRRRGNKWTLNKMRGKDTNQKMHARNVSHYQSQYSVNIKDRVKLNANVRYKQDRTFRRHSRKVNKNKYANDEQYRNSVKQKGAHKYKLNPSLRDKILKKSKERYKLNHDYRYKLIKYGVMKYRSDQVHRKKIIQDGITKYKLNHIYRRNLKLKCLQNYHMDDRFRAFKKSQSRLKYMSNTAFKKRVKDQSKDKYQKDGAFQLRVKEHSKKKYQIDEAFQIRVKEHSKKKYQIDKAFQIRVKEHSKKKYQIDEAFQIRVKEQSKEKYRKNKKFRRDVKTRSQMKYKTDSKHRDVVKKQHKERKLRQKIALTKIDNVINDFKKEKQNGPNYICCVCHRLLFNNQVIQCKEKVYKKSTRVKLIANKCISRKYLHECTEDCQDECNYPDSYKSLWICHTCDRKIKSGKVPPEAMNNNLDPGTVAEELKSLNSLETHLISLHIAFTKMVNISKYKQHKVTGTTVCVPSNIIETTNVLPRCENENQLIRIKLKRRLSQKGYYEYQYVCKKKLEDALRYLKFNNKYYSDIEFNSEWESIDIADDEDDNDNAISKTEDECSDFEELPKTETEVKKDELYNVEAENLAGPPLPTCLEPTDIVSETLDNHFDSIFSVSPAEGNSPVRILTDETNEAKCFPTLFPNGSATYHDNRENRITLGRYLHCRLMNVDTRFARSTDYIFYAQYMSELSQIISNVSIALRKGRTVGNEITCGMLADNEPLKNVFKNDEGYKFMTPIRGTPPYWQAAQKGLFAMLRQLGIPSFFATFSFSELRGNEVIESILKQQGDNREACDLDWTEKCQIIRSNPITCARMFDHRFHYFLKHVIMSDAQPIGKVVDYFYRLEFQCRGSPHAHCLFWIENAPKIDEDGDKDVVDFIDKYITCELPNKDVDPELHDIVDSVQRHSQKHTKSCRKNKTVCRFNFPRPPSKQTFICRSTENYDTDIKEQNNDANTSRMSSETAKGILEALWKALSDKDKNYTSVDQLYEDIGINQELFQEANDVLSTKNNLVLKRRPRDVWINPYNKNLLRAWDCNMDLQYVFDAYSCIVYIVSYISKSEREMGIVLSQAQDEAREGNLSAKESLRKISTVYLNSREVSAQEAAFRVCNLRLRESSRFVQFIPTGQNNIRLTLPLKVLQSRSREGTLTDDNMFMTNIVDRYRARPKIEQFTVMCLATFCSEYRVMAKSERINEDREHNPAYRLQNDLGYIIKRSKSKPAIIRYARFSLTKDPENYYLSSLQLFLPHRNDEQLRPPSFKTYEEFYKTGSVLLFKKFEYVKDIVGRNRNIYEKGTVTIDAATEMIQKCGSDLKDAWSTLDIESQIENLEYSDMSNDNTHDDTEDVEIPDLVKGNGATGKNYKEPRASIISKIEAIPMLRRLNKLQTDVFYKIRQYCLDKIHGKNPEQFMVFLSGGAGTGKSFLIKTIFYEASRILSQMASNPDEQTVLIVAPTGVSAMNLGCSTIHNTLAIKPDAKLPYVSLGLDKINTLRANLGNVQILIIDEISMVSNKLLCYIHGRFRQIKQSSNYQPFGNVSVICVGDFYQLPAVKAKSLYVSNDDLANIWHSFKIVQLEDIMRQKDDIIFAQALNRLRTKKRDESLNDDDTKLFKSREIDNYDKNVLHIYATNSLVNEHNANMLEALCNNVCVIEAIDYSKDERSGKMTKIDTITSKKVDTCLASKLHIAAGARVMLIKNLDVSDGLCNGVFGNVKHIDMDQNGTVKLIYVKFDIATVGAKLRKNMVNSDNLPSNYTPIGREEERINYRSDIRRQFPLKLAYACTVHKVQGLTVDKAVVSLKKVFSPGQAYVALSRVTKLDGLVLKDFNERVIYCDKSIEEALNKMALYIQPSLDARAPTVILLHNIQGLPGHYEDIKNDYRFTEADFICLTETWVNPNEGRKFEVDGFRLHYKTRMTCYDNSNTFAELKVTSHGGVGLYYKNKRICKLYNIGVFNIEFITFNIAELNITVTVMYRSPNYKKELFIKYLQLFLDELNACGGSFIIMGDFNENSFKGKGDIQKCFEKNLFHQLVTNPTTDGNSLLDLVFVRNVDKSKLKIKIISTYFSYHNAVELSIFE